MLNIQGNSTNFLLSPRTYLWRQCWFYVGDVNVAVQHCCVHNTWRQCCSCIVEATDFNQYWQYCCYNIVVATWHINTCVFWHNHFPVVWEIVRSFVTFVNVSVEFIFRGIEGVYVEYIIFVISYLNWKVIVRLMLV